ncbi:hypothetical protein EDB86DRAFT_2836965 [Lactarius hatsudake]|nr:hypothetical protein EDB86DRAFT_2836965 [Lactarius hatsudake]
MTDWKSPAVVTAEYFALIKLYHATWGILIWEFVVNIGFKYSVFTGKRNFRLSFLVHCVQPRQDYDMVDSGEALIVLRMIAISIAAAVWLADVGSLIHGVVILHGTWNEFEGVCQITNPRDTSANIIVSFVTDLALLALMLIGLLRWENARRKGGIWWLLYTQGLAWMIIVTLAEAPITCLLSPDEIGFSPKAYFHRSHEPFITMTIGASHVYRGLSDYVHKESDVHMSRGLPVPTLSSPLKARLPRTGGKRYAGWPYVRNGFSGTPKAPGESDKG